MNESKNVPVETDRTYYARRINNSIRSIDVYKNGTIIVKRSGKSVDRSVTGERGMITELSAKARARMLWVIMATEIEFRSMITLTYPIEFPVDGRTVKAQFAAFKQKYLRRYAGDYFWFLEFQKRGAPHIHFMVTRGNVFSQDRLWCAREWIDCIGLTDSRLYSTLIDRRLRDMSREASRFNSHDRVWEELRSTDGAKRYCAKYALKTSQKSVPTKFQNVGRFYGYSKAVKSSIQPIDTFSVDGDTLRDLLATEGHRVSEWDVLPKIIFGVESLDGVPARIENVDIV